jgi:uncharacterized protein YjiS (DUF1127 family)
MNIYPDSGLIFTGRPQTLDQIFVWLSWLQAAFARLGASWIARWKRAQEMEELQAFSDRELWDLGLCRSDVRAIAEDAYRRD